MPPALELLAPTPEEIVALLIATSFAAGLNVYATVGTLGLLSRFEILVLPAPLSIMDNWWVIGACAALFALEFVVDKIPVVDLLWNALQTFVRVPAGALLAYGAATPMSPGWQLAAAGLGATIAFAAHAGKTAVRAAVTPSPEPVSNAALSLVEDALAIGLTWFAVNHPFIAAGIVVVLLAITVIAIHLVVKALKLLFRGAERAVGRPASSPTS